MSFQNWLALAAMAVAPAAAIAQQAQSPHPSHEATATGYQSAFEDYKRFTDDEETPETRWRGVNEEMGKLGGHAAHIKGDSTASPASPTPAKPSTGAPKADAPVDHSQHH